MKSIRTKKSVITQFLLLLVMTTVIISCTKPKEHFTISANLKNIADETVFYLKNWETNQMLDSCKINNNGSLFLKGKVSGPQKLFLYATEAKSNEFIYTNLLIGNEDITFNATKSDFPWNINTSGSIHQDIAEKFNQVEYKKLNLIKQVKRQFSNNEKVLSEKLSNISDSIIKVKIDLIKENSNSYAALNNFKYYKKQFSTKELNELYDQLGPELKQSKSGKAIKLQINYPPPSIGDKYYDYTAIDQNGKTVTLSEIKDKFILLHFSSAACYYSQLSLPELKSLYKEYDNLEIVKISQDIDQKNWEESIIRDSIPWVNLWDGKGEYSDAVIKYGSIGSPNYVLISPNKIVLEKWFGYNQGIIKQKLQENIK